MNEHLGLFVSYEGNLVYKEITAYQEVIIFDHKFFGRMLMLDGSIQLSEKDEHIYHTSMTENKITKPNSKVLIIGGGDGGILKELCKSKLVSNITLVELDQRIIDISKTYLPFVSNGAFNDDRLNIVIGNGIDYINNCNTKFDVIFMDCTDPDENSEELYSTNTYNACRNLLNKGGKLVVQVPCINGKVTINVIKSLTQLFTKIDQKKISILSFAFGELLIFCAVK